MANYLQRVFTLDFRSLALFRIGLGLLVLADLAFRLPVFSAMHTGGGMVTRELSQRYFENQFGETWPKYVWSLYWISDSYVFATALFGLTALAAVLVCVGKWTRVATFVCWLLIASLHNRNPLVTSSGDYMFKMMLFWSMFLPLGAVWSLAGRGQKFKDTSVSGICSFATAGFVFQLFAIYFFPGIAKWNSIWIDGEAMSYVLRLDIYLRDFGRQLLRFPGFLSWVSWGTLAAEVFFICGLFSGWRNGFFRLANMAVYYLFHIGIAFCLAIGMFPWICMLAWLPLIPGCAWQRDIGQRACDNRFRWSQLTSWQIAIEAATAGALATVIIWNLSNTESEPLRRLRTPLLEQLGYQLALDQHFQMFGIPPSVNPWFVYEGILHGGRKVDLWTGEAVRWERPERGLTVFPEFHWRKLHHNAVFNHNSFLRQPLLDYAVRNWNATHPDKPVGRARLICFREDIGPTYNRQENYSQVWGNYVDENSTSGSLFESTLDPDDRPKF